MATPAGPLSGALVRSAYYEVPPAVHVVDPAHEQRGQETDPGLAIRKTVPAGEPMPPSDEYIGAGLFDVDYLAQGEGVTFDQTPVDHMHAGSHSLDEGAAEARLHRRGAEMRGPGETYTREVWKDFGPEASAISQEVIYRGINSHPQNNPPLEMYDGDGFRYGFQDFATRGRDRRFLSRVIRSEHGARAVYPNTAHIPPPSADDRTAPLWRSLARNVLQVEKRPTIPRTPPALSDVLAEDGGPAAGQDESIIGVF